MIFKVCCVCGLSLPISVMQPIKVRNNKGQTIVVGICDTCKKIKEQEAKEEK